MKPRGYEIRAVMAKIEAVTDELEAWRDNARFTIDRAPEGTPRYQRAWDRVNTLEGMLEELARMREEVRTLYTAKKERAKNDGWE